MAKERIRRKRASESDPRPIAGGQSPAWWPVLMVALMIIGLLWVVTFYLTGQQYPVPSWGKWNLGAGFAIIMVGFLMTSRWR